MHVVSLEYHDVVADGAFDTSGFPGTAAASYKLDRAMFADHLRTLARNRGRVGGDVRQLTLAAGVRPVLLTFDDGGESAHSVIAPLLSEFGWLGHFFVTADFLGTPGFVDGNRLRALHQGGHVIGSHSSSHPLRMASFTRDRLLAEWRGSIARLEDAIGAAVDVASIPGGAYSRAVAESASEAGIRYLFTSEPTIRVHQIADCRVFGRYTIRQRDSARLVGALVRPYAAARLSQWARWNAKKIAKALGGELYLRARSRIFERGGAKPRR